jgi:hypothetical protein
VTGDRWPRTPNSIRSANGELTVLYEALKPKPASQPEPAEMAHASTDDDYIRRWCLTALQGEHKKMRTAEDGECHNRRYASAFALDGLLHTGGISEDEITDALSINFGADEDRVRTTIADGIAAGQEYPRDIPAPQTTTSQIEGCPPDDDLDSLDPAELRRRLRETIAERDHWRGIAEHADIWRDWALQVAAIPTETLSPAAKIVTISLWPEMRSRESRGVVEGAAARRCYRAPGPARP